MHVRSRTASTALRRLAMAAVLAATALVTAAPAQAAAPGVTYLCSSRDYSCLAGTGYTGQSTWGSWGPGHNCVSYAAFRLAQTGERPWPGRIGSGIEWDEKARAAGVVVDKNPAVGAIAQWDNYGAGHVGYVDLVTDSHIHVSEDNFSSSGSGSSTIRRIERNSAMFADADFIHVRDASVPVAAPPPAVNRVQQGVVGDGALIDHHGAVYKIVGGAPLYVSTYDAVGGPQPSTTLTDAEFASLRWTVRDGTVLGGAQTGEVFRVTGGAPLYISTFDVIGGPQPVTWVDSAALDHAGAGGVWSHLNIQPADGTTVATWPNGEVYRFAGGAPIYVSTFDGIGGWQPMLTIDQNVVDRAGGGGRWNHAAMRPGEGTVIHGTQTGRVYVIRGGHPVHVSDWSQIGGPQPTVAVDQVAIDNAGGPGLWSHLG